MFDVVDELMKRTDKIQTPHYQIVPICFNGICIHISHAVINNRIHLYTEHFAHTAFWSWAELMWMARTCHFNLWIAIYCYYVKNFCHFWVRNSDSKQRIVVKVSNSFPFVCLIRCQVLGQHESCLSGFFIVHSTYINYYAYAHCTYSFICQYVVRHAFYRQIDRSIFRY